MTIETRNMKHSATEQRPLYMPLELGGKTWKLGFGVSLGSNPRIRTIPARDLKQLDIEIARARAHFGLSDQAPVFSCYEAGRDGFWLHRHLESRGIDNVVVEPASVLVDRRARRAKTDRLDVGKLLRHLIRSQEDASEWRVVRVPSVEQEDQRHLHRELSTLKRECGAHTSRIKSLLALHGVRMAVNRLFLQRLESLALPEQVRQRIEREYQRRTLVLEQIGELQRQRRALLKRAETVTARQSLKLSQLRGIGEHGAWTFCSELFSWRDLQNRRQVASLLGITPTPFNSDTSQREQGISKAGLWRLRALAVELAWLWLRYQPQSQLSRWFQQRFGNGQRSRKVGIVALARRLTIALWHYVEHDAVPEGALLKA